MNARELASCKVSRDKSRAFSIALIVTIVLSDRLLWERQEGALHLFFRRVILSKSLRFQEIRVGVCLQSKADVCMSQTIGRSWVRLVRARDLFVSLFPNKESAPSPQLLPVDWTLIFQLETLLISCRDSVFSHDGPALQGLFSNSIKKIRAPQTRFLFV